MKKITSLCFFALLCFCGFSQEPFWQSLNPGAGGRVQGLYCDPADPGRMFFASDVEGFYVSEDYGSTWKFGDPNTTLPSSFIMMAKGTGNKIYVGHGIGLSYSSNGGNSFRTVPQSRDKIISSIEIDPTNSNNVYAGFGWQENTGTARLYPFTRFTGWTQVNNKPNDPDNGKTGEEIAKSRAIKEIIYTNDGGTTWNTSSWDNFSEGDGRIYSIEVDPTNSNHVVIANVDGLYRSTNKGASWSKINGPSGIDVQTSWGADFTPDGNWLYAIYRKGNNNKLFVKQYPSGSWQDLGSAWDGRFTKGNGDTVDVFQWRPTVYTGSSANEHFVLISQLTQNPKNDLIEARVSISGTTATVDSYERIFTYVDARDVPNGGVPYDTGWNPYQSTTRHVTYYPEQWENASGNSYDRGVLTMSNQSFFTGDAVDGNDGWRVTSSGYVQNINGQNFYRSRGAASTFTYDVAAYENYMIQAQADNGFVESWDGGQSWRQAIDFQIFKGFLTGVTDCHGVHVLENPDNRPTEGNPSGAPIVLASSYPAFGGGARNEGAFLYTKTLDLNGPDGTESGFTVIKDLSRDSATALGLPNNRIWEFHTDPNDPNRLYVGTEAGIWVCDDIYSLLNDRSVLFRDINGTDVDNQGKTVNTRSFVNGFDFDAGDSNTIYYKCQTGTWKGTRQSNGSYNWNIMTRIGEVGSGQTNKLQNGGVASVKKGSNVYTYTFVDEDNLIIRTDANGGDFTKSVLNKTEAISLLGRPEWWDDFTDPSTEQDLEVGDMVAVGDVLYIPIQKWDKFKVGYGFAKGTVQNNGDVNWENWSADAEYPVVRQIKAYQTNGSEKILMATRGAGVIARKTNGQRGDAKPPIRENDVVLPQPPEEFAVFLDNFQAEQILWEGVDTPLTDVQTSASSAQASEGSSSQFVLGLTKSAPESRAALRVNFRPIKATGGILSLDITSIIANTPAFNIKLLDRFGGFVDIKDTPGYNGNLVSVPTSFTNFRIELVDQSANGGPTFNPAEFSGIQFEYFGDTANDRFYIDNIFIEGDNIVYSNFQPPVVNEIRLTPTSVSLEEGEEFVFDVEVLPAGAVDKSVTYEIINSSLGAVNPISIFSNRITALQPGTASVQVTSRESPSVSATIDVTVGNPDGGGDPEVFYIQQKASKQYLAPVSTGINVSLEVVDKDNSDLFKWRKVPGTETGYFYLQNVQTGYYFRPRKTGNPAVYASGNQMQTQSTASNGRRTQWQLQDIPSDNEGFSYLVNLDATGFYYRPNNNTDRNLVMRPTSFSGSQTRWKFVPADGGSSNVSVTGVSLTPANVSLTVGGTRNLNASVSPLDATDQNVSYSSSNTAVATVNSSGRVTAVSSGNAVITVTTADGGFTDTTNVTVTGGSSGGNGDCSATSPAGKPNPPCEVRVQVLSPTSVRLFWNDNSNNENFFDIQQFQSGDRYRGGGLPDAPANSTSIDITNIVTPAGEPTTYKWRIKAVSTSTGGSVWVETDLVDLSGSSSLKGSIGDLDATQILLYPNPTRTSLYIVNPQGERSYSIFDLTGRLVKTGPLNESRNETKVDVSNLGTGMYSVRIADKNFKMLIER